LEAGGERRNKCSTREIIKCITTKHLYEGDTFVSVFKSIKLTEATNDFI